MENLNEDFKVLSELIRTAYKLISPISYQDDIKRMSPEFLKRDYVKTPNCYLAAGDGNNNTIFPICNRYGYKDPDMIRFSLKLAKKIVDQQGSDQRDIPGVIVKLEKMLNKYDKPVPNTMSQAIAKSLATRKFNKKTFGTLSKYDKQNEIEESFVAGALTVGALYQALRPMMVDFIQATGAKKEELRQKIVDQKQKIAQAKAAQSNQAKA